MADVSYSTTTDPNQAPSVTTNYAPQAIGPYRGGAPLKQTTQDYSSLNPYASLQAQQQDYAAGVQGALPPAGGTSSPLSMSGASATPFTTASTATAASSGAQNPADLNRNGDGSPISPSYVPVYDSSTMALLPQYEQQLAQNSQSYNNYVADANRTGPSSWANLSDTQQATLAEQQRELGANSVAGQTAQAQASLASQGGLSSGARERVAEGGAKNFMSMAQNTAQQQSNNDMNIGVQDEQNRIGELGNAVGMQQARTNQWDTVANQDNANQMTENSDVNAYNQNLYNQEGTQWGAKQQAAATEASGK